MAEHRHKRETAARRTPRAVIVAAPLAFLATTAAVTLGVASSDPHPDSLLADSASSEASEPQATQDALAPFGAISRAAPPLTRSTSRSDSRAEKRAADRREQAAREREARVKATVLAVRRADTRLWTTAALNLWTSSGGDATQVGVLPEGERVLVTGRKESERTEVVVDGKSRWVTTGYLSEEKPLGGDCTNGTSVASGVSPNIVKVHQAVCGAFPEITTYGTFRSDGEHSQGIAVDIMVSGDRGWQVANFVRDNYADFGVSYVIYAQRIWSVERSSEGWRAMSDRGSATANHYDHVHVTTY